MRMQVDALLFDFGGTIDTDGVHWCEKYWDVYQELGIRVPREAFERAFVEADRRLAQEPPSSGEGFFRIIQQQVRFQFESLSAQVAGFQGRVKQRDELCGLTYRQVGATVDRARPLLRELGHGRRLAIVSNFNGNMETVLEEFHLRSLFAVVVDSTVVGVSKPDPEIFRLAIDQIGADASRCAVIGDSYDRDIVPGKAAGCHTIWVKGRSWREWPDAPLADATVNSIHAIPDWLG
jgi:FMN hydrolase / 5-amino-6-(5-phospho-D-ribitylamino)uracil phosphatase